ncbi:MAG: PilZ domain-containing protein [Nitrospirota bacterium]
MAIAEKIIEGVDVSKGKKAVKTKKAFWRMSGDRRQHKRSPMITMVKYSVISSVDSNFIDGLVTDMSGAGMQLLTTNPLRIGEKIIIKKDRPTFSIIAVVRWIKESGSLYYKVGTEFI